MKPLRIKIFLPVLLSGNFLIATAQLKKFTVSNPFTLEGHVTGISNGKIYLLYSTPNGWLVDSSQIKNGRFYLKGSIKEPTYAQVFLLSMFSESFAEIFIEPAKMQMNINPNNLRNVKLVGSYSQKEFEKLKAQKMSSWKKIDSIKKQISSTTEQSKISNLRESLPAIQSMLHKADSLFIIQQPESIISAYLISSNLNIERFKLYPVDPYFNKLPGYIKESSYGTNIQSEINKMKLTPINNPAPKFSGTELHGTKISLDQYFGNNYVLLDFWGSWCGPCRRLNPFLKEFETKYRDKGLQIISIAINDKEINWKKAIQVDQIDLWIHLLDDSASSIRNLYSANAVPLYFLIDPNGNIKGRYTEAKGYGEKSFFELVRELDLLFSKSSKEK